MRRSVPPQRDADAAKKAATESLRKEENVPAQIKVQEPPYTPALRGIFPVESTGGEVKDSGAARDSLRRADTLKTKRETLHRPPEPRGE